MNVDRDQLAMRDCEESNAEDWVILKQPDRDTDHDQQKHQSRFGFLAARHEPLTSNHWLLPAS